VLNAVAPKAYEVVMNTAFQLFPDSAAAKGDRRAGSRQAAARADRLRGADARRALVAAHIGVLKVLERERVPICAIAGTSMGSIVGGLYAAGYSPEDIEHILAGIDWRDVLNDDPPRGDFPMRRKIDTLRYLLDFKPGFRDGAIQFPRGAIQGQKLLLLLRRLTLHTWRTKDFDQLRIPFRAVATDIVRGEPVIFDRGDLALAIRASMSVPAAFQPIKVDGRLLVDGGIVNNVPVDVAKAMGADRLIVVDVGAPLLGEGDLNSPFAISMQMLDILMKQRTAAVMADLGTDDIKIQPDLGDISSAAFDRSFAAIAPGERAAELRLAELRQLAIPESEYTVWREQQRKAELDPVLVDFLDVVRTRSATAGYVERELAGFEGRPLDVERFDSRIGHAYGQGNYERIAWRPVEREGRSGIEVTPVDKGWGPNYLGFGLQISDNFEGRNSYQLGFEYTMTGINRFGGEWRSRLEFGEITGLRSEFFQPAGERGQYYVFPYLEYRAFDQPVLGGASVTSQYRLRRSLLGLELGYEPDRNWRFYAAVAHGRGTGRLAIGDDALFPDFEEDLGEFRLGFLRDTLDDADFRRWAAAESCA
jgi:NTE family protein